MRRGVAYYSLSVLAAVFWVWFLLILAAGILGAIDTAQHGTAAEAIKLVAIFLAWSATGAIPGWLIVRFLGRATDPKREPMGFEVLPPR